MTVEDIERALDGYEEVAAEGRYIGGELPIDRPARRKSWAGSLQSGDYYGFVAVTSEEIVGQAGVQVKIGIADLGMWVLEGWRGRGIGSALLATCIEQSRAARAHKVTLQVWPHNNAAIGLYEKFGFEQEGRLRAHYRRRNGELWDAIIMGLCLDGPQAQSDEGDRRDE
jgi:ribosomal protein S18 acetylase RimI-like enzyme